MSEVTWFYFRSEPGLYTVGFYDPAGKWQRESDHGLPEEAAARVHFLNGETECGQRDRDARILAESNIELLVALKKLHHQLTLVYEDEVKAGATDGLDSIREDLAQAQAAILKAED